MLKMEKIIVFQNLESKREKEKKRNKITNETTN